MIENLPKTRSPTPSEVREEIDRARDQIASSAVALRQEISAKTDWREWIRGRPTAFILGAFAVGLMFGIRRRR